MIDVAKHFANTGIDQNIYTCIFLFAVFHRAYFVSNQIFFATTACSSDSGYYLFPRSKLFSFYVNARSYVCAVYGTDDLWIRDYCKVANNILPRRIAAACSFIVATSHRRGVNSLSLYFLHWRLSRPVDRFRLVLQF